MPPGVTLLPWLRLLWEHAADIDWLVYPHRVGQTTKQQNNWTGNGQGRTGWGGRIGVRLPLAGPEPSGEVPAARNAGTAAPGRNGPCVCVW